MTNDRPAWAALILGLALLAAGCWLDARIHALEDRTCAHTEPPRPTDPRWHGIGAPSRCGTDPDTGATR